MGREGCPFPGGYRGDSSEKQGACACAGMAVCADWRGSEEGVLAGVGGASEEEMSQARS